MIDPKMRYHLYVVRPGDIEDDERYFLITSGYCLLYTANEPPAICKEVRDVSSLPEMAKSWLNDCIETLRRDYLIEQEQEILKRAKSFTEAFEAELEQEKIRFGSGVDDGE